MRMPISPVDKPEPQPKAPPSWWQRAYYGSAEWLRHQILLRILSMPPPEQFIWRNRAFKYLPKLFASTPQWKTWQAASDFFISNRPKTNRYVDLAQMKLELNPPRTKNPRIAVHAHIYYADMAAPLAQYFTGFPQEFDLYISSPFEEDHVYLSRIFSKVKKISRMQIAITPNQGRDIAPFLDPFGKLLLEYDYIAHVHTKKSIGTNAIGSSWCNYLWETLLSMDTQRLSKIWALLQNHALVYPEKFQKIDVNNCRWGEHLERSRELCTRLGIKPPSSSLSSEDFVEFPVGSMFWARADALAPLLNSDITYHEFEEERGKTDGTLSHVIERNLSHIALAQGLPIAVLKNTKFANAYP